jgi:autotransporter adhesin
MGVGSVADRSDTISVGNAHYQRQITNVAPGTQATDAVNLGQIWQVRDQANSYAAKGIAQAMAMPSVNIAPGKTQGVAIAVGSYGSYQAIGFEYAKRNGNTQLSVGGAYTPSGDLAMRASATFSW